MSRAAAVRAALRDRVVQAVLVLAVLALAARLVGLGARVAHQDEARVGYWTLRYLASGQYEYRPIVHGPFIPLVDARLFELLGPSDFVARLPMAVLGAAMPAFALLFRTRLRDAEVVALAALLAANPALLYYSRFMRQDLPLAAFAVLTLGLAVRAVDASGRRRRRYVYAAGLAFGLAATTKENVLLYPLAWAGALALVLDQRLIAAADPLATARDLVPDPPRPAVAMPAEVRRVAPLAFLGASPPVAAVLELDGAVLGVVLVVSALGYVGAVRGATLWHLVGGLPLLAVGLLGLVRSSFDPGLTTFVAGLGWILAALLLVDERVFAPPRARRAATDGGRDADAAGDDARDETDDGAPPARSSGSGVALRDRLWPLPPLAVAYLLVLAVVVSFYAPRGGGYPAIGPDIGGWGLWSALAAGSPDGLYLVLREATYGTWSDFLGQWAGGSQDHAYIPFFLDYVRTLGAGALTVTLAGVAGTLYDRYGDDGREFVAFCAYWGFASVLGYPLVTDIQAPWATLHSIVALAVPAAVALAAVYRVGRAELTPEEGLSAASPDWATVGAAAVVLLAATAQVGWAATDGVYRNPQSTDNELVQYAQSGSTDHKQVLRDVRAAAAGNDGVDVLYYGGEFDSEDETAHDQPPAGAGWFDRLPLAYYLELYRAQGVTVVESSTTDRDDVRRSEAPVVVAVGDDEGGTAPYSASEVAPLLESYGRYDGQRFLFASPIAYFVDTSSIEEPAPVYADRRPALSAD